MKIIKTTNNIEFFVDDEDFELVNSYKWRAVEHGRGFRVSRGNCHTRNGNWHSKCALVHRFLLKAEKHQIIDHIDGNPLNNQRSNLRFCTFQQNLWNKPLRKDSKSGVIGVRRNKNNSFTVRIQISGKRLCLGTFNSIKEAASKYNEAATIHFGEFARLNLI